MNTPQWVQWLRNGGFREPRSPHLATVEATPGKTTLSLTRNGTVIASVVLSELKMDYNRGTTAEFVELSHFMIQTRAGGDE